MPTPQKFTLALVICASAVASAYAQTGAPTRSDRPATARTADPSQSVAGDRSQAGEQSKGSSQLSAQDKKFVTRAAESGLAEVLWGQAATQRASAPKLKELGQHMADEHAKANEELKQLAATKNIPLPTQPNEEQRRVSARLEKASGKDFDQVYMKEAVIKSHQDAVKLFEDEAKNARDPELKAWAQKTLPTIQSHYETGRQMTADSK